jgi:hypothetical protein
LRSRETRHAKISNVWVYGDEKLVRGSGLFVGEAGVVANHHFLTPRDVSAFHFSAGCYKLEVFANLLGDVRQTLLFSQTLDVSQAIASSLGTSPIAGLYFDWGPDSSNYLAHVKNGLEDSLPTDEWLRRRNEQIKAKK